MSRGHILVVEDHPDNQQLVSWILEDEDYEVTCVGTAEACFDALSHTKFDAILMDISLPGMDGKEATKILRAQPQYAQLPIFALTAHNVALEQQLILASGVTGILSKPIDEDKLIQCLAAVVAP